MICVLTHQGLGDHIICNGLIRSLLEKHDSIVLFVKENIFLSVQRMYDNESRIFCFPMLKSAGEEDYFSFFTKNKNTMKIGFSKYWELVHKSLEITEEFLEQKFDYNFYKLADINFENRWKKFSFQRSYEDENRVFKKLNPDNEPYIFVHDDIARGFALNPSNPNNYKIIKNDPSELIFSMISILENAEEIHCMESSFNALIECLPTIKDNKLFYHSKVRNYPYWLISTTKRNWSIID
jgi:hypothetical protein